MPRVLIIGYGNPYRGDDAFGMLAAEQFKAGNRDPDVQVEAVQELHPEFAELISQADLVLFLDASPKGAPGTVEVRPLAPAEESTGLFSHELTPSRLLAAARVLYGRSPEARMITVTGEDFGLGAKLSPPVEAALSGVLAHLQAVVAESRPGKTSAGRPS